MWWDSFIIRGGDSNWVTESPASESTTKDQPEYRAVTFEIASEIKASFIDRCLFYFMASECELNISLTDASLITHSITVNSSSTPGDSCLEVWTTQWIQSNRILLEDVANSLAPCSVEVKAKGHHVVSIMNITYAVTMGIPSGVISQSLL